MSTNKKVAGALDRHSPTGDGCSRSKVNKVAGASSSKAQARQREQDAPATLVPELRFPQFFEVGEWEELSVDQLLKSVPTRDHQVPNSAILANGRYPVVDQGKELIAGHSDRDDLLFRKLPVIVFGDHTTVIKYINFEFVVGADGTKLLQKRRKEDSLEYLFYVVDHFKMEQEGYKRHFSILRNIQLPKPTPAEQQKIADCLGSLDDLIAAHSRKLAALQDHKKGLLQQLFPAEGETTPKLRFPEFEGEWKSLEIGEFGKVVTGSTPATSNRKFYDGPRMFVSPADISGHQFIEKTNTTLTDLGFEKTRPIRAGSTLFVCIGSTIGKVAQNRVECATNQQINAVIPSKRFSDAFVFYCLLRHSKNIASFAGNQAVPIINKSLFSSIPVLVPELQEQQKIADCLSALDALITAQTEQIAALKEHKKGLMQQLFPNPELSKA